MSTNKGRDFRLGEILKGHQGYPNNKNGQDKCYVYKNHITKIRIISDMTIGTSALCKKNIFLFLIYYKGVVESTLQRVLFPQPDISSTLSIQR